MKKFAYLLTLLLLIVGGNESAFAAVDWGLSASSLESITANQTVVIKEAPSGLSGWSSNAYLNSGSSSVVSDVDYSCIYKFVENGTVNQGSNDYQVYVLYNLATGKYLAGENSYTENINDAFQMVPAHAVTATSDAINGYTDTEWTNYYNKTSLDLSAQTETLWTLCKKDGKSWLNFVGNPGVNSYYDTNIWLIYSVEESKIPAARLSVAQEAACAEVDVLAQLTTLFSVDADALKSSINAVSVEGDDVDAAFAQVNSIVRTAFNVNNKSIIFSNLGSDDARRGLHITAGKLDGSDVSKAFGTASTDNNKIIWTLKDNGDGTFKLYNVYSGLYLGTAASAGALSTDASAGANFTFVIRGINQVSLKDHAGNIFHQLSYWSPNYSYKAFNSDDAASNWKIESVTIADEEQIASYKATKASLLNLAYPYFQDKYGLVKDAAKMSVVVIETQHPNDAKPVSNLLDGDLSTYVHSSYGTDKGKDPHYIQVELSEAQQYIMFYMAKRDDGTNNNRPATIKVYVSSDGTDFGTEPVATLENLHLLGNPYYSPQINLGGSYKYVRFVVSSTNTGSQFFTASEFYVLPINDETAVLSTHDVTTINDVVLNLQNTLLAKAELYAPMNEANALLAAHALNHAAVPALGQYTTTAYKNLQTVVNSEPTLAKLNEALDAFDKAQNRPVFLFTSANDGGYSNNSAIYDEGSSWKWKAKNYYDKSMFFTVKDLTATELTAGTAYNMYDYATGRSLFYDGTVTPEAVSGKEGVFNLKVNTGKGYLHCQNAENSLVTWNACAPNEAGTDYNNMASAWRFEYVGNSFDFDNKTDFPVSANELLGIQLNCTAANFGGGLGQYSGVNYSEVEAAKATVEALQEKENAERYSITETEARNAIEAVNSSLAGATLNQPATNKFYRFKNLSSKKYLTSTLTDNKMTMGEAGNTRESVFYLTEDNKLISYENGLFPQNFTSGNYAFEAVGSEGHAVVFAQGNPVYDATSCYHLSCGVRSIYGKNATVDAGGNVAVDNTDNGYDWAIEEVEYLPVAVSSTVKYGTLYAPVDLSLRPGVEAYTATVINGSSLQLQAVTGNIPAGTAVILKDNGAERDPITDCIYLRVTSGVTAVSSNDLTGTYKTIAKPAQDIYTLQNPSEGIGFYKYVGENLGGFKAYLAPSTPLANGLSFDFGAATGLDNVATELPADAPAYDLTGRRVNKNTKGIIIVGNKKVINL